MTRVPQRLGAAARVARGGRRVARGAPLGWGEVAVLPEDAAGVAPALAVAVRAAAEGGAVVDAAEALCGGEGVWNEVGLSVECC